MRIDNLSVPGEVVDVSELCARLSPVEWSGLNYEYMVSCVPHTLFKSVSSGLFCRLFLATTMVAGTAWRSLTEILIPKKSACS